MGPCILLTYFKNSNNNPPCPFGNKLWKKISEINGVHFPQPYELKANSKVLQ
jgi:hypothetical protein